MQLTIKMSVRDEHFLIHNNLLIGRIIHTFDVENNVIAELGYSIFDKQHRGSGRMAIALPSVFEYYKSLGYKKLQLRVYDDNIASQKTALRAGFKEILHKNGIHTYRITL